MNTHHRKGWPNLLILINLGFIWGNSLMTGTSSGNLSGGLLTLLGQIFPVFATPIGHTLLRKGAHFSEFCLLGLLCARRRAVEGQAIGRELAGFGLSVACIDETIQFYVPGRASRLLDVWIDTAGFCTGMALYALGHTMFTYISKRRQSL